MTASIVILQLAILGVVLESDLGLRKIGWFRVMRPVIAVVVIVPAFFTTVPTAGHDLLLQAAGALAGLVLGLFSVCPLLVSVSCEPAWRSRWFGHFGPERGRTRPAAVSRAGLGYAVVWSAVTVFRLGFAYGAQHWFPAGLGQFMASNELSATALTNAFIFLSIGMDLFRSIGLWTRGRLARPPAAERAPAAAVAAGGFR
jgi:hypothetical protein